MLSDPITITYDAVAKVMPRASGLSPFVTKVLDSSSYASSNGEFVAKTTRSLLSDKSYRTEVLFTRFDSAEATTNSFGMVFISNHMGENPNDIGKLRTALESFVTPAIMARFVAGEL